MLAVPSEEEFDAIVRRDRDVKRVDRRAVRYREAPEKVLRKHAGILGKLEKWNIPDRGKPCGRRGRVAEGRLLHDDLRGEHTKVTAGAAPPVKGELLMGGGDDITAWPRGEVTDDGGLEVYGRSHGLNLPTEFPRAFECDTLRKRFSRRQSTRRIFSAPESPRTGARMLQHAERLTPESTRTPEGGAQRSLSKLPAPAIHAKGSRRSGDRSNPRGITLSDGGREPAVTLPTAPRPRAPPIPMPLAQARQLIAARDYAQAREVLLPLAAAAPHDAEIQYETACVHDSLGFEAEAVPFYRAALAAKLAPDARRGAFTGLGSTYRTLGRFAEARDTLEQGLAEFPDANEMRVFLAMTDHNLGQSRKAVETLLSLLAKTTNDPAIAAYRRAIEFYAQDVDRTWPSGAGEYGGGER